MKKSITRIRRLYEFQLATSWWRRLSVALVISISLPALTYAQSKIWDKTIGGNRDDLLKSIQQTKEGGYILGGDSESDQSGDKTQGYKGETDYWIVKQNASGTKVWDKTFGGAKFEYLSVVLPTKDGGYLVGGSSSSGKGGDKSEPNKGGHDYWIIKLNANGSKAWDKTIGGGNHDFLSSVVVTPDGSFLLGGFSYSGISGDKSEANKDKNYPSWDYWIVKLRADGSKEWDKTIGGNGDDYLRSIQLTSDGGYIAGGSSNSGQNGDKTQASKGSEDYWIVKLNAYGNKVWDKTLGGQKGDELEIVQQTPDGSYLLGGTSDSGISGDKSENSKGTGTDPHKRKDYWLVKLKEDGTKVWDKTIGGNEYDGLTSLLQTKDGSYILGGSSESGISGDKSEANRGVIDFWVVKLNASGDQVWDKTIGGDAEEWLTEILPTNDGSYLVAGSSSSNKTGDKSQINKGFEYTKDYWIVKLTEKTAQTITFAPIPSKTLNDAPFTLSAKATSGLPVTFKVVSGPSTIKGNTITLTGPGKVTVKATQAGNATYAPTEATQSFTVQATQVATKIWDKAYGGIATEYFNPNQTDECDKILGSSSLAAMVVTPDGGYLLGGTSDSKKGNDKSADHRGTFSQEQCYADQQPITDYWLVKTDVNGNRLWDKTYGGNNRDELSALIATPDGGYLVGGSSLSNGNGNKSQANRGYYDYWIVKIDANGNKVWDKTFGGDNWDLLTTMVATPDGGYLLGGSANSGKTGDKAQGGEGGYEYWVIRIDANGNKLWDKAFDRPGNDNSYLQSMITTPAGGYLLGGFSEIDGDYWVVEIDTNGNKLWDKTFGGSGYDYLTSLANTPDGGYLLGGYSNSDISGDKTEPSIGSTESGGSRDYWIVKIDSKGNKLWDKTYGGNGHDDLTALMATPDGGYLLGGHSTSTDFWVIKIDEAGNKLWDKFFGGSNEETLSSLLLTADGSYLLGGTSDSGISGDKSQPLKGVRDFWIVKIKDETTSEATAWDMRYGGIGDDILTSVIKTSDGGYLSGGYTYSGKNGDKTEGIQGKIDYWIVKSDKNGKKLWDKRFGGSFDDFLNRVIQTSDGGYLLAGSSRSGKSGDKSESGHDNELDYYFLRDFWLVKVDAAGNKQWDKTLGGYGFDELEKVIQLSSGEYVLAGHSNSPASGDKSQGTQGGYDYWLVKVDTKGNKIWDKRFGGTQDEKLGSFTQTRDGGFLLGGTSQSGRNGDKSEPSRGKSDYWIVRTDKDGNKLWDKTFGGTEEDDLNSVGRSNGDTFFLAGTSNSSQSGDKTQPVYPNESGYIYSDYWVIKIDGQGNKIWDKAFGSNQIDDLKASTYTRDGGYLLGGMSYANKSGDKTENGRGSWDFWLVKLDANGSKQWDKTIGGAQREDLRTVFQTNDGGYLVAGSSVSGVSGDKTQPNHSQGGNDYWLVKLAPDTSPVVAARAASTTEESVSLTNSLTAYPNPFQDKATISFTLPETQQATVKVYDGQGNEVATLFNGEAKANQQYEVEWNASNKPTGLYFLQLQTSTKKHQQKLLLTK